MLSICFCFFYIRSFKIFLMYIYNNILQKNKNIFNIIIVKILIFFFLDEGCYKFVEVKILILILKNVKYLFLDEIIDG